MADRSRPSLLLSTGFLFLFMALLNLSLVLFMVYENQLDLILRNVILTSRLQSRDFQSAIGAALGSDRTWAASSASALATSARTQGISNLTVFREDGTVLLAVKQGQTSERGTATAAELATVNRTLARQAFEGLPQFETPTLDQKSLEVFIPFALAGGRQGVAQFLLPLDEIPRRLELLNRQAAVTVVILLVIHLLYAFLAYRQVFSPLRRLLVGVRAVSQGNLEVRIPVKHRHEIGELAEAFNEMGGALKSLTEEARGANPLSGLPGNVSIAREIDTRLTRGDTFAVLYSDLDNFKAYNDKYGFTKGDEAILYTRDCLVATQRQYQESRVFLGHEGGDDFVVICDETAWLPFVTAFLPRFDSGVKEFYNESDALNGYIDSVNRQGVATRYPLMSISVAVVSNKRRAFHHHAQMVEAAAQVKKLAKKKDGSSFAEDSRTDSA